MNPTRFAAAALAVLTVQGTASQAFARTPYLLPNTFNPEQTRVTVQAASTEDDYFNPDGALAATTYVETLPSGEQAELAPAAKLKDLSVIEAALSAPGTYRFSTGDLVTRTNTMANVGGRWLMVRQPRPPRPEGAGGPPQPPRPGGAPQLEEGPPSVLEADVPADAQRMKVETVWTAETYVSKGAPTDAALKTRGQGLELKPAGHPNAVYVDQGFSFQLLVDGAPGANLPIAVYRAGNNYDDRRIAVELKTDAKGLARIPFKEGGVYLLTTHYPATPRAPTEAPPPRNYTYSLTFEVTR